MKKYFLYFIEYILYIILKNDSTRFDLFEPKIPILPKNALGLFCSQAVDCSPACHGPESAHLFFKGWVGLRAHRLVANCCAPVWTVPTTIKLIIQKRKK